MRITILAAVVLLTPAWAAATELTITIPGDNFSIERLDTAYECSGERLDVEYINAGPVSLAIFTYDGQSVVAANVLSASGARYAGAQYVWWSKGAEGFLYDLMQGEDAEPVLQCTDTR